MRGRRSPPSRAGLIVPAAAVVFLVHAAALRFTQDDAYISLQYARNLVEGHGLVFNVGERVEGFTNFAWTMLLALLLKLGLPALEIARVLGVVCAAAALVIAARFARAIEGRDGAAAATGILVAASSPFALWSTSGMETGFYTLLVTAGLLEAFAPETAGAPKRRRNAALLFALAALTRPDAPLFFAAWISTRLVDVFRRSPLSGNDSLRGIVRDVAIFAAPLVPFALWKLAYYGDLVPNTFYAKSGVSSTYLARGLAEAKAYVLAYGWFLVAPALAAAAAGHDRHGPRLARLLAVSSAYVAYVIVVGGDVLPLYRFWLPILPAGCALVVIGAGVMARRLVGKRRRARLVPAATALAMAVSGLALQWKPIRAQRAAMDGSMMEKIGVWLGQHLGPSEAIAATPIGAVAYYSRRRVIDMLGLVDREIARRPEPIPGLTDTWKEKKYNAASVLRRRPGAILFSTGMRPSAAGEKALFLYEDFHASYYPLYFRPDRQMLQPCTIYRLRPDAPAPADSLRPTPDSAFLTDFCSGLIAFWRERRPSEAARLFERSVRIAPPFFVGDLEWWATTLYDLGDPRAVPLLEEVLRLDPYAFRASTRLGHYHVRRGELDVAEAIYRAQLERNPEDAQAWEGLAEIARRRGDLAGAFDRIRKSLSLWSTSESARGVYAALEEMVASIPPVDASASP